MMNLGLLSRCTYPSASEAQTLEAGATTNVHRHVTHQHKKGNSFGTASRLWRAINVTSHPGTSRLHTRTPTNATEYDISRLTSRLSNLNADFLHYDLLQLSIPSHQQTEPCSTAPSSPSEGAAATKRSARPVHRYFAAEFAVRVLRIRICAIFHENLSAVIGFARLILLR